MAEKNKLHTLYLVLLHGDLNDPDFADIESVAPHPAAGHKQLEGALFRHNVIDAQNIGQSHIFCLWSVVLESRVEFYPSANSIHSEAPSWISKHVFERAIEIANPCPFGMAVVFVAKTETVDYQPSSLAKEKMLAHAAQLLHACTPSAVATPAPTARESEPTETILSRLSPHGFTPKGFAELKKSYNAAREFFRQQYADALAGESPDKDNMFAPVTIDVADATYNSNKTLMVLSAGRVNALLSLGFRVEFVADGLLNGSTMQTCTLPKTATGKIYMVTSPAYL